MPDIQVLREIDPSARVAADARIGPYCVIGPHATIGPGTVLKRRVCVTGHTTIGSDNVFEEGCVLGVDPQDLKYAGGATLLQIGHRNAFGRNVTAHVGTETGGFLTRVGNDNVLMDGSHVAHDCYVDDRVTLRENVMLAGHIRVCAGAVIGELSGVHHFVTVGVSARVLARTPVRRDVPPYTVFGSDGGPPGVCGLNEDGIVASPLAPAERHELRAALHEMFDDELALQTKIEQLVNLGVEGEVAELCKFCQRSLQGVYGRHREAFRGKVPPEAARYLTPEQLARIQGMSS